MRFSTFIRVAVLATLVFAIVGEETATAKGGPVRFGADVAKMLDILINSLYTNRNIFLREIISNASDALDKIRFIYLTNPKDPKNDAKESPTMDIRIKLEKDKREFIMTDGGVGMTKEEMAANLGSLGSSGTKNFLEKMKDGSKDDSNLIGQFGVGFYSVFLVAERVRVASKSDDSDKQWIWESTGDGTYYIYEDSRGNTLGRGTELTLVMKADADEYLESDKVKEIVHRYSEFIHFPIYLQSTKVEKVPKKKDEAAASEEGEVKDEGEKKEEEFDTIVTPSWDLINENKPIWTRKVGDVTEDEYNKFYKALTKDYEDPMYWTHFSAEGEVEFKAILFIPGRAPYNVFDTSITHANIRLYVRRVFITDEFRDLLPRYLNFVKGVVDSDDLPLNVSREVLQESRILKIIKRKLVRKALMMFQDIAENDKKLEKEKEGKKEDADEEKKEEESHEGGKKLKDIMFPKFWEEFGKNLRLGMIEDGTNRARLTKLLRYKSSKSEDKMISLQDYVDRMPETQKHIYFIAAESIEKIKQTPVLEDAIARDIEVIFMTDAIDEYVVGHVTDFSGKKLQNLAKDGVKFGDKTKREKAIEKKREEKYEPLISWFKNLAGSRVTKVVLTTRKISEPLLVVSTQHGQSVNGYRIAKGQTLGERTGESEGVKGVLEINYRHPLIDEIFKRVKVDPKDAVAEDTGLVLFDTAALQNGFEVTDSQAFSKRVNRLVRQSVDIAVDAPLVTEDLNEYDVSDEEDAADEKEEKKEDL
jgi:HSP90 family molecular chaperone